VLLKLLRTPFGFALDRFLVRWWGRSLLLMAANRAGVMRDAPVLLLQTVGRKSGKRRSAVLPYFMAQDAMFIIGSKGGAPKDPAWAQNLRGQPEATVYINRRKRRVRAHFATGDERRPLWAALADYPLYAQYQEKAANREIPLIVLNRIP
jgi:deazaflavin-dependent oxidoreductase (nitroreductase family)